MNRIKFLACIFFLFSTVTLAAKIVSVDLSEHGKDLMKAPFPTRYQFSKNYNKDWLKSTYNERKIFLTKWHLDQIQLQKDNKAKDKEEARIEKEKQKQIRDAKKQDLNRLKEEQKEEKQKEKDFSKRNDEFNKRVDDTHKEIKKLRDDSLRNRQ
jgi:hypothetical protein